MLMTGGCHCNSLVGGRWSIEHIEEKWETIGEEAGYAQALYRMCVMHAEITLAKRSVRGDPISLLV
jgi:hypothetical protein